ncbi:amino acid permease [Halomarina rubra]|uniref:Amino acid permease n=1 Tax=Halomarina rubra TaxID=2071873 RepID=A0ABD6AZ82_9EURY|nr:amino acid permease [Halomarina rubra]
MSGGDQELAKDLGPLAALTIGVGTMIGAGIFVLPQTAISDAGSFAVVSFLVGGVIALLTAFSASELGTAMPKSGGAYYYVNQALGPLFGSIAGWANWMGLAFASAFYMIGFGEYIRAIFGVSGSVGAGPLSLSYVQLIALAGAAFFILINYVGAKETGKLQNVIVVILVAILAVFTVIGSLQSDPANLPASKGYSAMLTTTGLIFVSYLGFVQITSVAEEIQEPGKNLPRAVIGSVVIVTVIYALVLVVMSASVEQGFIAGLSEDKIAVVEVARLIIGPVGAIAMLAGGLLATASSANASILASSRINFAMGRDRIVTPDINEVHPRFGTPYKAIGITGGFILLFIALGSVELLSTLGSILHLVIYALLNVALIVFRESDVVEYDPSYTVPLYPITPVLGALSSIALIVFINPEVIAIGGGFVVFAALWYVFYARSRTDQRGALSDWVLSQPEQMPNAAVDVANVAQPDGGEFRVMVPLANPSSETDLVTLASAIAKQRGGTVVATHIVTVPDQTALQYGADHVEDIDAGSVELLEHAREDAETFGVPVETHTVISHRGFEEVFDAAKMYNADLVVMGWGPDHGSPGRAEGAFDDLTQDVPCDFLVLKDRGFDPDRILVPTAGGPDSDLSARIALLLREQYGSEVTLLNVNDSERVGREFLESWAAERGLSDATLRVETGDVEASIERAADDATMLVVGATERGLLRRLVSGSLVMEVVDDVECSVLLAEQRRERTLRERLFG